MSEWKINAGIFLLLGTHAVMQSCAVMSNFGTAVVGFEWFWGFWSSLACRFWLTGEFSQAAWPYGPRRVSLERPHSAQYAKDVHRKSPYTHARPASAKAALVTPPRPPSARNTRPPGRPKPGPLRPASAPSVRPPSRPSSGHPAVRPSSARPASGPSGPARPDSARPASARPASATSSAQPDLEGNWTRPSSGISGISERPQEIPSQLRPQSAPVFKGHSRDVSHFEGDSVCSQPAGRSILFQQQDFLEKQLAENHGKLNQCFTTLMQNWVSSYQKSRLRARMACRPLFGEGPWEEISLVALWHWITWHYRFLTLRSFSSIASQSRPHIPWHLCDLVCIWIIHIWFVWTGTSRSI